MLVGGYIQMDDTYWMRKGGGVPDNIIEPRKSGGKGVGLDLKTLTFRDGCAGLRYTKRLFLQLHSNMFQYGNVNVEMAQ